MTQFPVERKSVDFIVGNKTYKSPSWSPLKAAKNLPMIGKAFAVPISFLVSAGEAGLSEALPNAMYMLFEQLEEQDVGVLFQLILADIWCKTTDKQLNIETDLDSLDELLLLAAQVLKQHYGCLIEGKGFLSLFQIMVPLHQMTQG